MIGHRRSSTTKGRRTERFILKTAIVASACFLLFRSAYTRHNGVVRMLEATGVIETAGSESLVTTEGIPHSPLGIPPGEAKPLPSIRVEVPTDEVERGIYGGKGDKKHLGGFTTYDGQGVSPKVWKHMISNLGVKSSMDVGCGKVS